jgi:SAM-dependent methyltransferase
MARNRPTLRGLARRALTRIDRAVFPEASSGSDQWQRVVMNDAVRAHIDSIGPAALTAVEISGNAHQDLGWKSFRSLDYPEFDICAPTPQDEFDVVICEQVLEHVIDPWGAVRNLRALCRPGGHVIVTTPFLIKVHELPLYGMRDYWRFTPRGIRVLLESAGLEVVSVRTWGNRMCVYGNLDRWSGYRRWLPLGDRPDTPVQVWAFATNPSPDPAVQDDGDGQRGMM